MKTTDNVNYQAEDGNFIVRKADEFIMGEGICLGSADSIENYEDRPFTEESYRAFYEGLGMEVPAHDFDTPAEPEGNQEEPKAE